MAQIFQLRLKISNAFLIIDDNPILIDTGSPNETDRLLGLIKKTGVDIQDLALIVHTHAHIDHCGCTADIERLSGAPVVVHQADMPYFEKGVNAPFTPQNLFGKIFMPLTKSEYPASPVDILMSETLDLSKYGVNGKVIETPGHSPGSVSVLLDNGEAVVGDLFGGGRLMGFLQPARPRHHPWHFSAEQTRRSIKEVLKHEPARIHVGHGGPLDGPKAARYFKDHP